VQHIRLLHSKSFSYSNKFTSFSSIISNYSRSRRSWCSLSTVLGYTVNGSNSVFSTITSAGGGGGGAIQGPATGSTGGSGGGGSRAPGSPNPGGAGNTPPTSPPQGNNGVLEWKLSRWRRWCWRSWWTDGGGHGGDGVASSPGSPGGSRWWKQELHQSISVQE
jgi:hypothetical protein